MSGYPPIKSWNQRLWSWVLGTLALVIVLNLIWSLLRQVLLPLLIGAAVVLAGRSLINHLRRF